MGASGTNGNGNGGAHSGGRLPTRLLTLAERPSGTARLLAATSATATGAPDDRPRATANAPRGALGQVSYSGTPGYNGLALPDDYVHELADPEQRMALFEEMRSSDESVATAINARVEQLVSANWTLTGGDPDIRAFVEDNVYPVLTRLLRLLADGRIHYGFAAVEPVFAWADRPFSRLVSYEKVRRAAQARGRLIYLRKIAHIRQRTVIGFEIGQTPADRGDIQQLVQSVYTGTVALSRWPVPVERLMLSTFNQQGDDPWGVPPSRYVYRDWRFKQQLEKLNLLGVDRFGVGTPVVEEGQGWTEPDRTRIATFMKAFRAGKQSFLMHPSGGKVTLVSGDGSMLMSVLEWTKFYATAIAKVFLTQLTELGTTDTGSRAVGDTFMEQLAGVVQSDCDEVASVINERLIVPLVMWNYGEQDEYPAFTPSGRVTASSAMATVLSVLYGPGKAIKPRAEDEPFLRDVWGMPPVSIEVIEEEIAAAEAAAETPDDGDFGPNEQTEPDADDLPPDGGVNGSSGADESGAVGSANGGGQRGGNFAARARRPGNARRVPVATPSRQRSRTPVAGHRFLLAQDVQGVPLDAPTEAPDAAVPGTTYRTVEYSQWEDRVVRPQLLSRDLELEVLRTTAEIQAALRAIDLDLISDIERVAQSGAADLAAAMQEIAVDPVNRARLREAFFQAAMRARDYGEQSVLNEIARQQSPDAVGPSSRAPGMAPSMIDGGAELPDFFSRLGTGIARIRARVRRWAVGADATGSLADPSKPLLSALEVRDMMIGARVDKAVADEIDRREAAARSAVLNALAGVGSSTTSGTQQGADVRFPSEEEALAARARATSAKALEDLSPRRTANTVQGVVNGGFAAGRDDAGDRVRNEDEVVAEIYSAVLDEDTCEVCAAQDGAEYPPGYFASPSPDKVRVPNPRCDGGYSSCRCIVVYVLAGERRGPV